MGANPSAVHPTQEFTDRCPKDQTMSTKPIQSPYGTY